MYRLIQGYLKRLPGGGHKEGESVSGKGRERALYTPHSLRATTATLLLDAGVDSTKVKELLGHRHITTTQIYDKRRRGTKESALMTYRFKTFIYQALRLAEGSGTSLVRQGRGIQCVMVVTRNPLSSSSSDISHLPSPLLQVAIQISALQISSLWSSSQSRASKALLCPLIGQSMLMSYGSHQRATSTL